MKGLVRLVIAAVFALGSAAAAADMKALELSPAEALAYARAAQALQVELRGRGRRARRVPDGQFDLFSVLSPALTRECARAQRLIRRLRPGKLAAVMGKNQQAPRAANCVTLPACMAARSTSSLSTL